MRIYAAVLKVHDRVNVTGEVISVDYNPVHHMYEIVARVDNQDVTLFADSDDLFDVVEAGVNR